jgi:hypothetical protein
MFNLNKDFNMTDFNLEQGKELLNYNSEIDDIVNPHLKLIEKGSLIEGMNIVNLSNNDKKKVEGLQNIENEFNKTLSEYTQTYQQFSEDLLNKNQSKQKIVNYLGKVISDTDGNNYYVNNYGYTHKYSPDAWENNNTSCPSTSETYNDSMNNFEIGYPMNSGQPCKMAGKNIKNSDTGKEAWVDIKGVKHEYVDSNRTNSCAVEATTINNTDYNLIPTGSPMTKTDTCIAMDINPTIWVKLQRLNNKLKNQAKILAQEMGNLDLESNEEQLILNTKKDQLMQYIHELDNENKSIIYNNRMLMKVSGEEQDATLRMNSNYYHYILWIILAIILISLTLNATSENNDNISIVTYVIIIIFVLIFAQYLYRKLSQVKIIY